jgi:NADH-quinone oxidoreductase subunit N
MHADGQSFGGMIQFGAFVSFFNILFCAAAFFTVALSRPYLEREQYHRGEYYILLLFAVTGMMLIAAANDLIVLFLGIELMSLCLYILAGFLRMKDRANEAALKYFLLGAFSTGFLLYGIALVYGTAGSTNLGVIRTMFAVVSTNSLFLAGAGLILVGLAFKASIVPFHMWAPDVYEGAPTTVTAFMSTGAKAAAFAALMSVFLRTFDFMGGRISDLMAILAAASMILGNVVAIAQTNIKRMLAYSSIAHAGYMLSGIAAGSSDGLNGILFYLAAYTVMNLGAFAVVAAVERSGDRNLTLDDYAGFGKRQPLLAFLFAVFLFALAGVPPFAGFLGKYLVFLSAVKAKMTWLAIVGVLTSLVSAFYYLRVVVLMYFNDGASESDEQVPGVVFGAAILCALAVLVFGIFPSLILQTISRF